MSEAATMDAPAVAAGEIGVSGNQGIPGISSPEVITPAANNEPWYGQLPETLTAHQKFFDQFKDRDSFFESAKETKAALSRKLEGYVKLPGENASPEDLQAYRQAMGVPDDPTGYEITAEDALSLPGFDPEALGPIREAAHALGMTSAQLNGLVAAQARIEAQQLAEMQQAERDLVNQWGDDYEYRVGDIANRVGEVLDVNQPFMSRVDVLKALDLLAADFREDTTGGNIRPSAGPTLDEQITAIRGSEAYLVSTHKDHVATRERLQALYRTQAERER